MSTMPGGAVGAGAGGEVRDLRAQLAALRADRQRPGREVAPGQLQVAAGVEEAQTVGADHPGAVRPQGRTDPVVVGHPGGDRQERARACRERLVEDGGQRRHRDAEDHQLGSGRERGDVAEGPLALDDVGRPVHQPHVATSPPLEGAASEPVAPLRLVVGGSDDGDGARVAERRQGAGGRLRDGGHRYSSFFAMLRLDEEVEAA